MTFFEEDSILNDVFEVIGDAFEVVGDAVGEMFGLDEDTVEEDIEDDWLDWL